ncbi:uncharacterized protein LOC130623740 [Hydractinia symbiolongicarpus]|uniref:uncharacterized protein LOC130623740 n=1 Tax=Hydractinia symbiolongicarpus TaxID=13093 RepID=UPI0025517A08|nr:uncharacterized protein LOC130623740 [Hydractinia symbiolongicarpus]
MYQVLIFVILLTTANVLEGNNDKIKCEDDPQTSAVCPAWKKAGACENNRDTMRIYCRKTCNDCRPPSPPVPKIPKCASTQYGCCWDNVTVAKGPTNDISQSQCMPCLNRGSKTFCNNWKSDCNSAIIGQGDVMRTRCPETCQVPCDYNLNKNLCRDDPAYITSCIQWYADGKCTSEQAKMRVLCASMCGFCSTAGR